VDGVILADKPAGVSSHAVVAQVRRRLGGPRKGPGRLRVGHAGTLDPFATGLLVVLVGRATRAQRFFMSLEKEYLASARFGWTSTTGDPEGELVETGRMPPEPLELPTGTLLQRPPAFSAVKVGGRRAYALARAGEEVELAPREVHVHEFTRVGERDFRIRCSAGTYVRTLIGDLGDAYCTALRRTAIGPFRVDDAGDEVLPLGDALARFLPIVELDGDDARALGHGRTVAGALPAEVALAVDGEGPVALVEAAGPGSLRTLVGLR
jgi:tRNA pseudouridine55 synthase